MSSFVPGGQAGEESQRVTREAEMEGRRRRELRDAQLPKRPTVIKRLLHKLRCAGG